MFKKILWFTDIHFGRFGDSVQANQDNIDFINWAVDRGKSWGAETMVFGGDWHNNRHSLAVSTIYYSIQGLDILNRSFKNVFFIPGNHDLLYREKRDVASIEFAKYLSNITIIRDAIHHDDISILPWLIGDEVKKVKSLKQRYVFGHLEMPHFMMNAKVVLPESPHLATAEDFKNVGTVFTGHFHMRQTMGRVVYTGNVFPFNFSDANDDDRGIMLLEYGKDPIFEKWDEQPLYWTGKLTDILENADRVLKPKMTLRTYIDTPFTHEETEDIKETLISAYGLRKLEIINARVEVEEDYQAPIIFQTVDQMVLEGFQAIQSSNIKVPKLIEMYKDAIEMYKKTKGNIL